MVCEREDTSVSSEKINPEVSVIVPVYKAEKYIDRCARTLFNQTLSTIEYIFVDDCSPDMSILVLEQVIADYPSKKDNIHIISHKNNKGASAARNTGLNYANGKFVIFCDADDWVEPNMYEALYHEAILSQADIVICDFYMDYVDQRTVYKTISVDGQKKDVLGRFLKSFTSLCYMLVNKRLYADYNLRLPEHIRYREDFHLGVRLVYYANGMAKVDKPLYHYNRTNENSLLNINPPRRDDLQSILETIEFFEEKAFLKYFERELSWDLLQQTQSFIWEPSLHQEYLHIYPKANAYIWSCPNIGFIRKCMMWMLAHHLIRFVRIIASIRKFLRI